MTRGGKRSPETEIKPGQVLNPHGRPKVLPLLKEAIAEVLNETPVGEKRTRLRIILDKLAQRAEKGDSVAIRELLDRYYGKAKESVHVEHSGDINKSDLSGLTYDQLYELKYGCKPD